ESGELAKSYTSTMMSARLLRLETTEEGQAGFGAEQLQVVLNVFFNQLMTTITDHGGDILRLAGDALIVAFTGEHRMKSVVDTSLLLRAALVSALCIKRLDGTKILGHVLHLHIALGVGNLELYTVGGPYEGWQYVAAGAPFSDLASSMDDGTAGEMILSRNYWNDLIASSDEHPHAAGAQKSAKGPAVSADYPSGSTMSLGGLEWRLWDIEGGNVKIEATADAESV
ncbi:unnamed protein product, partial [Sphacelaria rigidula]